MSAVLRQQMITAQSEASTAALIEACGLPEIGSVLSGRSLRVAGTGFGPFTFSGTSITISPAVSTDLWTSASILREALELVTLGVPEVRWAHRIVAHATASIYGDTVLANQPRGEGASSLILGGVTERLLSEEKPESIAADIAKFIADRDHLGSCPAGEIRAAGRALPLSYPTEVLLTLGGDQRQMIDWEKGVNSYGLSPRPVPWRSQFGSCTASSPSPRALEAASALRHNMVGAAFDDLLDDTCDLVADSIRSGIRGAFDLSESVDVILTPSGTDAEFLTLILAAAAVDRSVHCVVLAPDEIGSGSLRAASGLHFSQHAPFALHLEPGAPVAGFESVVSGVSTVSVRDSEGRLRPAEEVELEMGTLIESKEGPVLVHSVEGTKTGVRLPRSETLSRWEKDFGDRMVAVVDAAQVRVDQSTVTNHVNSGRMVIVTGSKFFGGPPFSGAVLVPPQIVAKAGKAAPSGLAQYLSRDDIPASLPGLRRAASPTPNFALLLRWAAAMSEISSFMNASPEIRDEILRRLVVGVRQLLDSTPHTRIVESPYTMIPSEDHRGLDELPTIFSFLVLDEAGAPLSFDDANRVHLMLATDLSDGRYADDRTSRHVLRPAFHLGQPVAIEQGTNGVAGALRFAIGAPTLSQIVFDVNRGESWRERLDLELAQIQAAVEKIAAVRLLV